MGSGKVPQMRGKGEHRPHSILKNIYFKVCSFANIQILFVLPFLFHQLMLFVNSKLVIGERCKPKC